MLTQQVRQINERKGTCISRKFSKHTCSGDMKVCRFFLARLPSRGQVNAGRVVSCKVRLMSLLKPLGEQKICSQLRDITDLLQQLPSLETKSISIKTEPGEDRHPLLDWKMGRDSQRQRQHRLLASPRGTYQSEHLNQADMVKPPRIHLSQHTLCTELCL